MSIITKFREQIGELLTSQTVDENGNPIESITTPPEEEITSRQQALQELEAAGVLHVNPAVVDTKIAEIKQRATAAEKHDRQVPTSAYPRALGGISLGHLRALENRGGGSVLMSPGAIAEELAATDLTHETTS